MKVKAKRTSKQETPDPRQLRVMTLYFSEGLIAKLQRIADGCGTSLSQLANEILDEALIDYE